MATLTFAVPDMSCGHCVNAVETELRKVAGFQSVSVDLDSKQVVMTGADLDLEAVWAAVREAGYEPVS